MSGVIPVKPNFGTASYTSFYVTQNGTTYQPQNNKSGFVLGHDVVMRLPLSGQSTLTVTDSIGVSANRIFGTSLNFSAQGGGIYEVASTGINRIRT